MKKHNFNIQVILSVVLFFSATANGMSTQDGYEIRLAIHEPETVLSREINPCDIIGLDIITDIFELDGVEIGVENKKVTYPSCKYTWQGENKRSMDVAGRKMEFDTESVVMVVMVEEEVGIESYNAAINSYTDELEELAVGDKAVWSNERHQMTVLSGNHLFHVMVDVVPDNSINKKNAIALSQMLISKY